MNENLKLSFPPSPHNAQLARAQGNRRIVVVTSGVASLAAIATAAVAFGLPPSSSTSKVVAASTGRSASTPTPAAAATSTATPTPTPTVTADTSTTVIQSTSPPVASSGGS